MKYLKFLSIILYFVLFKTEKFVADVPIKFIGDLFSSSSRDLLYQRDLLKEPSDKYQCSYCYDSTFLERNATEVNKHVELTVNLNNQLKDDEMDCFKVDPSPLLLESLGICAVILLINLIFVVVRNTLKNVYQTTVVDDKEKGFFFVCVFSSLWPFNYLTYK
jgi:hypothetical protein